LPPKGTMATAEREPITGDLGGASGSPRGSRNRAPAWLRVRAPPKLKAFLLIFIQKMGQEFKDLNETI